MKAGETVAVKLDVPVLYLTQLLGLAMGITGEKLGLELNLSPVEKLQLGDMK
jgi:heterodisulfide reductase subunit B